MAQIALCSPAGLPATAAHRHCSSSTAWPSQTQCIAARVASSSNSSSSGPSACSTTGNSSSGSTLRKQQRGRALRVLSSRTEPSSLQSSYDEQLSSPASSSSSSGTSAAGDDYGYMQEYAALKAQLLDNTRKSGGAIGAYLLLTVNGQAALLAMLGAGASYAYLLWLCRDVDAVQGTDLVPIWEANKIENPWLRRAAKVKAAYQKALSPRLLVPVALGVFLGVYNRATGEPLPLLYSGCLLLGFLSYKGALVSKLVADLSPKFGEEAKRPTVEKIEDELDQWGRPKKRLANPIDVMPDDMQEKAYQQLEEQLAKEERRQGQEPQ